MWIFLNGGLLMPSATPFAEANPELTHGIRGIQVRGRLTEHLEWFRDVYVAPYTDDYSEIEQTPDMDYNCRFYMTHEEFAAALGRAVLDIDYRKFKPTAEGTDSRTGKPFKHGGKYHGVLNSIWGTVLRLAPAGGHYGPRSKDNPNGYLPRRAIGSSFREDEIMPDGDEMSDVDSKTINAMTDAEFDAWWRGSTTAEPPKATA